MGTRARVRSPDINGNDHDLLVGLRSNPPFKQCRLSFFEDRRLNLCRYLGTAILEVRLKKFSYCRRCHRADLSCYFQPIFK